MKSGWNLGAVRRQVKHRPKPPRLFASGTIRIGMSADTAEVGLRSGTWLAENFLVLLGLKWEWVALSHPPSS
jgi:hypothetical protein